MDSLGAPVAWVRWRHKSEINSKPLSLIGPSVFIATWIKKMWGVKEGAAFLVHLCLPRPLRLKLGFFTAGNTAFIKAGWIKSLSTLFRATRPNPANKTIRARPSQRQMSCKHKCVVRIHWPKRNPTATFKASSLSFMPQEVISKEWTKSRVDMLQPSIWPGCVSLLESGIVQRKFSAVMTCPILIVYELESRLWCWSYIANSFVRARMAKKLFNLPTHKIL